jgi:L-ribulokinase
VHTEKLAIGIDFGTDSVRTLVVDTVDGEPISTAIEYYPRWKEMLFCDPGANQFRQHPLDYIESMEKAILHALDAIPGSLNYQVVGIGIDTTGSTPVPLDQSGTPLALHSEYAENPNAMFILWKDHTAIREADDINRLSKKWAVDYTKFEGGIYSSEWFWAKILHVLRTDPKIGEAVYSWAEHCDWIPFLLTGGKDVHTMKRSRCAAGHKALWHASFGGIPPNDFFIALDPLLDGLRQRLYNETYTSDIPAGKLCREWADRLQLTTGVVVSVGAFDAHMGAVGGQIEPYYLSKVMGTSTCDMLVAPREEVGDILVKGICGQVDGSIIPGMIGMEAGQSAFGDVYAWFRDLLLWPVQNVLVKTNLIQDEVKQKLTAEITGSILQDLSESAKTIKPGETGLLALDWLNGRRTPDANQALQGAVKGLNLGTDSPKLFRSLVEATCFGARKIMDRFIEEGIPIKGIIGLGGVAKKSPFIMQIMSDILGRPIRIVRSEQTCALGAAMFAATAAGVYANVEEAMDAMGRGFDQTYNPDPESHKLYDPVYKQYCDFGSLVETQT